MILDDIHILIPMSTELALFSRYCMFEAGILFEVDLQALQSSHLRSSRQSSIPNVYLKDVPANNSVQEYSVVMLLEGSRCEHNRQICIRENKKIWCEQPKSTISFLECDRRRPCLFTFNAFFEPTLFGFVGQELEREAEREAERELERQALEREKQQEAELEESEGRPITPNGAGGL